MRFFLLFSVLMFGIELCGQEASIDHGEANLWQLGVSVTPRFIPSSGLNGSETGWSMESGLLGMRKLGNSFLSLGIGLGYAKMNRTDFIAGDMPNFWNPIFEQRHGSISYQGLYLSMPLSYRFVPKPDFPVYLKIGATLNISIYDETIYEYDEYEYHRDLREEFLIAPDQSERVDVAAMHGDIVILGLGYLSENWFFEVFFAAGVVNFRNDFTTGLDRLSYSVGFGYLLR